MRYRWRAYLLVLALGFLSFGGIFGGVSMLIDPSGKFLGMDEVLPLLPVTSYRLPGLFLLGVMGFVPLYLAYSLVFGRERQSKGPRNVHRAVTASFWLGVTLALWLFFQGMYIGFRWPIQYVTAANGALIIALSMSPGLRKSFTESPGSR